MNHQTQSKQTEFAGMPERTPLGKAVIEYLNAKNRLDGAKTDVENARNVAIEHFLAGGKTSITVEGRTVSYVHEEKDKLRVKGD